MCQLNFYHPKHIWQTKVGIRLKTNIVEKSFYYYIFDLFLLFLPRFFSLLYLT
jgi:hypothetical protein